jgi:Tfp pilus assembly protein PilE
MHKGEVVIGDRNFYLTVYRCGYNYRLIGQDNVNNQVYDGDVLKPQVVEILAEHNATITGTTVADKQSMIQLWQHQKVTKYIISRLGLAKVITSVTNELGAKKSDTRLALVVLPTAKGRFKGIEERTNLRRFLRDQSSVIERIEKREAAKAAALAHEKKYEKYMSTGGSVSGSVDTASPSRQSTAAAGSHSGLNTATSGARTTTSIFAVSPSKSTTTALSRTAGAGGSSGPNTPQAGRGTASLLSRNTLSFR